MKPTFLFSLAAALMFAGCSSGHFGSSVKVVGVNATPKREMAVLAPDKATIFSSMARERNGWLANQLRTSIDRELAQSVRFQPTKSGTGDGQVVFNSIRHGLLEVAANNYAVQVIADITLIGPGGKTVGNREFTATAGNIQPLIEFEDSKTYEESLASAADKIALELVADL